MVLFAYVWMMNAQKVMALTGHRGLIGSRLKDAFVSQGWEVRLLERRSVFGETEGLARMLEGCQVVVNLSGSPIIRRWTPSNMKEMFDSRIQTTQQLVKAFHHMQDPLGLFISVSATGIYEDGGPYSETNAMLSGAFLGKLCQAWEKEAFSAEDICRVVIFRLGVVLDDQGGALKKLLPSFKAGLGARIGSGKQYFPWVHLDDVVRAFQFAVDRKDLKGVANLVSPQIITNRQFTAALAKVLQRPAFLSIPLWVLKLMFGKGSVTLSNGAAVVPRKISDLGFSFHFPKIEDALKHLLKKE